MTTCHCCGQSKNASDTDAAPPRVVSSATIWVDAALLACCNAAHALAEADGAAEVEVAHLVCAIAEAPEHRSSFERWQIEGSAVAQAARATLRLSMRAGQPRTSRDLKVLIERTRGEARRRRQDVATLDDCVRVLLFDNSGLSCSEAIAAWCRAATKRRVPTDGTDEAPDAVARIHSHGGGVMQFATKPVVMRVPAETAWVSYGRSGGLGLRQSGGAADGAHISAEILACLTRQERLLAEMGAQLAARDAQSSRSSAPKAMRRKSPVVDAVAVEPEGTAAPVVVEAATGPRPAAVQPPEPVIVDVAPIRLRDRMRRGVRPLRKRVLAMADLLAAKERADRSAMLSLVPTNDAASHQVRMSVPRGADAEDEDEIEELDDDASEELAENGERVKRFYLALDDEIVRAPSIGPKTAARIIPHGIVRVRDLLGSDARKIAARIGARHITAERVAMWQDQARLVCTVPWLRGTHAQILVGAGFNTVRKILASEPIVVCAAIRIFATTKEGQRVLRAGPPPDDARVFRWVAHAQVAEVERAA